MQHVSPDGRLTLEGALTIRNAAAIRATLHEAITQNPAVSIDCSAAAEVDLSFIQLLVATRTTASGIGNAVTLAPHPDGPFLTALTRAGFRIANEDPSDTDAFWFNGATE